MMRTTYQVCGNSKVPFLGNALTRHAVKCIKLCFKILPKRGNIFKHDSCIDKHTLRTPIWEFMSNCKYF